MLPARREPGPVMWAWTGQQALQRKTRAWCLPLALSVASFFHSQEYAKAVCMCPVQHSQPHHECTIFGPVRRTKNRAYLKYIRLDPSLKYAWICIHEHTSTNPLAFHIPSRILCQNRHERNRQRWIRFWESHACMHELGTSSSNSSTDTEMLSVKSLFSGGTK